MRIRLPVDELNRIVVALESELVRVRRFWAGKGTEEGGNSMRLRVTGRTVLAPCAVLALSVGVATATARNDSRGNSVNAKLCQKNGWQNLFRTAARRTVATSARPTIPSVVSECSCGVAAVTTKPPPATRFRRIALTTEAFPLPSSTPTEFFAAPPVTSDDALAHTRSEASPRPSAARHAAGRGVPVGESMPQTPAAAREKARPVG